ncbi:hypothetical protein DERP_011000 [Dermatophagoides pteronyssinus]|uniref:Uncharacterized protein n=1 Tax=Dermatophagoides pteronyssinus TaxID=6956 RepID=A0ABQ8JVU5_DERPT|nr:hypothetical protein DERP_011000 [Dermatophagoides pteronyssinus]
MKIPDFRLKLKTKTIRIQQLLSRFFFLLFLPLGHFNIYQNRGYLINETTTTTTNLLTYKKEMTIKSEKKRW